MEITVSISQSCLKILSILKIKSIKTHTAFTKMPSLETGTGKAFSLCYHHHYRESIKCDIMLKTNAQGSG